MSIGIYKITNLTNQKIYIGQSVHIERRWQEHKNKNNNSVIGKAIQKYGVNNFLFEIIEECEIQDLSQREKYWINHYNSLVPYGYNIQDNTESQQSNYKFFTKKDLYDIIQDLQKNTLNFASIAKKYNLNISTISRINQGYIHHLDNIVYPIRNTNRSKNLTNQCQECGKEITLNAIRCNQCEGKNRRKNPNDLPVNRELLKDLIRSTSFSSIGQQFKVSDNTIRKWCKKLNLPYRVKDIKSYSDEQWKNI